MSHADRFRLFNEQYFGGRLPSYKVVIRSRVPVGSLAADGFCDRANRTITLRRDLEHDDGLLLHEMAHAATGGYHGRHWRAEMQRLAAAGAPVDPVDLQPPIATRLRRAEVEALANDVLSAVPGCSLRTFVKLIVNDARVPYCENAAKALKTYPWIRRVFEEVAREPQA